MKSAQKQMGLGDMENHQKREDASTAVWLKTMIGRFLPEDVPVKVEKHPTSDRWEYLVGDVDSALYGWMPGTEVRRMRAARGPAAERYFEDILRPLQEAGGV